jgi:hypothetical protein
MDLGVNVYFNTLSGLDEENMVSITHLLHQPELNESVVYNRLSWCTSWCTIFISLLSTAHIIMAFWKINSVCKLEEILPRIAFVFRLEKTLEAGFPLTIFFARSEFVLLSLGNLFQMVAAESSKTIAKCRFARKKLLVENRLYTARKWRWRGSKS